MEKSKKINYIISFLLLFLIYLMMTLMIHSSMFSRYQISVIILICINIILAVSLNITVGCLGQITIGHAGFMSVGAYTAALFSKTAILSGVPGYIVALILGGVVAGIIGVIIGIPALRLNGDYLAIITLAFGEIIRVLIEYFDFTGGPQGLRGIPKFNNLHFIYWIMVFSVILMFSVMTSRHGRAVLAIREDEIASSASGINTTYYKTFAFTLSAIFAGIAGGIYAHNLGVLGARARCCPRASRTWSSTSTRARSAAATGASRPTASSSSTARAAVWRSASAPTSRRTGSGRSPSSCSPTSSSASTRAR